MSPETAESVVEEIALRAECQACKRSARYCRCDPGAVVRLVDVQRALELVQLYEGCEVCPMGDF